MTEPPRHSSLSAGALGAAVELPERWLLGTAVLMIALALAGQSHGWEALPLLGAGLALVELLLAATVCIGAPLQARAHVVVSTLLLAGLCALAASARRDALEPVAMVALAATASLLAHPWPRPRNSPTGARWALALVLVAATASCAVLLGGRDGQTLPPSWAPPLLMVLALGSGRWLHAAARPLLAPAARRGLWVVSALVLLTTIVEATISFERRAVALPAGWRDWLVTRPASEPVPPAAGVASDSNSVNAADADERPTAAALDTAAAVVGEPSSELLDEAQAALRSGWSAGGGAVDVDASGPDALVHFGAESAYLRRIVSGLPAAGRAFRGGFWLRLPDGAPAGSKLDLLLMDERKLHRYARRVVEPTHEWTYHEIEQRFPDAGDDSAVTLRLGNDYADPSALSVLVRGASLRELSP